MTTEYTPEAPPAPDLGQLLNDMLEKQRDNLTQSQEAQKQTLEIQKQMLVRAIDYIHKTKTVINSLHDIIELHKQIQKEQRELLKHCLNHIENPKPRNQDLIVKAIKHHLEGKK